jgi:acetyl esterase/lipase
MRSPVALNSAQTRRAQSHEVIVTTQSVSWDNVVLMQGLEYGSVDGRSLKLNLIRPRTRKGTKLPVVVWIHGGWWRTGSPLTRPELLIPLVEDDYFVSAIEYRLSPEALFPAQIEDCKCAIRYLRANAARYGIDAERIGVWGASAGGHLVALLGTSGGATDLEGTGGWPGVSSRVQAVVDWYGPTDVLQVDPAFESANSASSELVGGPIHEHADVAARINPITYISPDCPPFLIGHGSEDTAVPVEQSILLYDALQRAGIESELDIVPGKGHEPLGDEHIAKVHTFFDRHLRPS